MAAMILRFCLPLGSDCPQWQQIFTSGEINSLQARHCVNVILFIEFKKDCRHFKFVTHVGEMLLITLFFWTR